MTNGGYGLSWGWISKQINDWIKNVFRLIGKIDLNSLLLERLRVSRRWLACDASAAAWRPAQGSVDGASALICLVVSSNRRSCSKNPKWDSHSATQWFSSSETSEAWSWGARWQFHFSLHRSHGNTAQVQLNRKSFSTQTWKRLSNNTRDRFSSPFGSISIFRLLALFRIGA